MAYIKQVYKQSFIEKMETLEVVKNIIMEDENDV